MKTGNFKNTSILLDILKKIKDESEIEAKALFFSSFQTDVDSDDRIRRQRYIAHNKF